MAFKHKLYFVRLDLTFLMATKNCQKDRTWIDMTKRLTSLHPVLPLNSLTISRKLFELVAFKSWHWGGNEPVGRAGKARKFVTSTLISEALFGLFNIQFPLCHLASGCVEMLKIRIHISRRYEISATI